MITAVDTNILLDILIPNQSYLENSLEKLENAASISDLIICEIVYTELASQFNNSKNLSTFLIETKIQVVWSNETSLFEASRCWNKYLDIIQNRQKGKQNSKKYCPDCGTEITVYCPNCGSDLNFPRRVLNDFIIGSHAKNFADVFLTRDRGFYRHYFSDLKLFKNS